jgi:hypothetical protein
LLSLLAQEQPKAYEALLAAIANQGKLWLLRIILKKVVLEKPLFWVSMRVIYHP